MDANTANRRSAPIAIEADADGAARGMRDAFEERLSTRRVRVPARPDESTSVRLLDAAVQSFAEIGYHATTTRAIAARAQMSSAAVYVHYSSKLELLKVISEVGHERSRIGLATALAKPGTHREQLRNAVWAFALWHALNHTIGRVVQYEFRHLAISDREAIKRIRRRMQGDVEDKIRSGVQAGEFTADDPAEAALAIMSMCVDIARWYSPKQRRLPEEIAEAYASIAMRIVGSLDPAPTPARSRTTSRREGRASDADDQQPADALDAGLTRASGSGEIDGVGALVPIPR